METLPRSTVSLGVRAGDGWLPGVLALSSLLRVFKCGDLTPSYWLSPGLHVVGAPLGLMFVSRQKQKVKEQRFHGFFFARCRLRMGAASQRLLTVLIGWKWALWLPQSREDPEEPVTRAEEGRRAGLGVALLIHGVVVGL